MNRNARIVKKCNILELGLFAALLFLTPIWLLFEIVFHWHFLSNLFILTFLTVLGMYIVAEFFRKKHTFKAWVKPYSEIFAPIYSTIAAAGCLTCVAVMIYSVWIIMGKPEAVVKGSWMIFMFFAFMAAIDVILILWAKRMAESYKQRERRAIRSSYGRTCNIMEVILSALNVNYNSDEKRMFLSSIHQRTFNIISKGLTITCSGHRESIIEIANIEDSNKEFVETFKMKF